MEHAISIRDVAETDYDQWRSLWGQYNAFYGREGPTALSDAIIKSTWRRFFDPNEQVFCLVAEQAGNLVGLAHYIFHRNTITIENTCYLQDLFSDSKMRGLGIGRQLVTEFYERARLAGTRGVYWHTHASNQTAMKLYDRMAENTEFVVYRSSLSKRR
ncbi:ribosomal protein S18 acetylase RimI-like enzyme [Yoonia maritima]|uniref:Ribosomal protein S18 acetylase RimI-like enzyme n=1 Tax=Yoonia maritima TaxID=1435347 RepID=A0A2T0VZ03_9RHOB|nr:GNAT family N-acetyltransferase [Yoonia maritima]PRY77575.1 ribosomal protein S18 acetylase RimI-like enzyme [Yoonia maritima]